MLGSLALGGSVVARSTTTRIKTSGHPAIQGGADEPVAGPVHGQRRRPLVSPGNFVLATRDTGYRTTSMAVAELVDNAVQAGATVVDVDVVASGDKSHPVEIRVADDGCGMDAPSLALALTFGGSSRFDDRTDLGRYGMGLPNGGLSQARRIEVFSWRGSQVLLAALDVDDILSRRRNSLAPIGIVQRPDFAPDTPSGTVVVLRKCDRLEHRRPATVASKLIPDLSRIYRWLLVGGLELRVNGARVGPYDPLMLMPESPSHGAVQFGDVLSYRLRGRSSEGLVEVRFSELPVERWHSLSTEDKRSLGVTSAPSVSVIRARREIDRGWFFMGAKRRENYDDWWRCEVSFEPDLDELFGITHSKQSINPLRELREVLERDLEPIARALNSSVRRRFELLKAALPITDAERQASRAARSLPPLPRRRGAARNDILELLHASDGVEEHPSATHRLIICDLPTTDALDVTVYHGRLVVLLNAQHPLYRDLYGPLAASDREVDRLTATRLTLALLAIGRAEVALPTAANRRQAAEMRQAWADILATFLNA